MGKYSEEAKELLKLIGGKENIAAVSHCITRMRFVLNDPGKADVKKIEAMKIVKGSFTQAGQFQVIIGNAVADFYNDFVAISGVEGVSKDSLKQTAKQNQNIIQKLVSVLAEIFAPLIPAIITGGLILGFRNCIDSLYLFENGTKTLVEISTFWSGVDSFLWLIGEAIFHMLPVGICWSVTKKMGTTQMLGIVLGLTLVSGQLLNAYAVAGTAAADIPKWDFGFVKVDMIGYQAQVLPAMFAAFTLVYIEKFLRKYTPQVISMIVVPFFSLVLSVMAAHFILGPIGWKIGAVISAGVYWGITGPVKVIFAAVFGFIYAPLVITGLHHMSNAIDLQLISDYSGTMLWPMIALSNIAQGSAVLAMVFLQRKNAKAQEVNVPSTISCYLGVTEPAMFGVNLKYRFPFICAMTGSALAAIISVGTKTTATAIGVGGIPGILSIKPQYMPSFAVAMIVAIAVPFVLTTIVGLKRLDKDDLNGEEVEDNSGIAKDITVNTDNKQQFRAFLDGKVITLKKLDDGVFSEGVLGEGLAIIPDNDELIAPCDGTVSLVIPDSRHAIGLTLYNGVEIMLHIGLDTVNMNGDGFKYFVENGQKVKQGDKLIKFDKDKIKKAGYVDTTVCVITNPNGKAMEFHTGILAKANETNLIEFK